MTGDDTLERLQADVLAILKVVPSLEMLNLLEEDDGDMEAKILRNLGAMSGGSTGRPGCVAVVMLPEVTAAEPNQPGPPMTCQLQIQVIEQPVINRGLGGTRIRSSKAALRILNAMHLQVLGGALVYADDKAITPVEVKPGFLSHMVTLTVRVRSLSAPAKPQALSVALVGEDVEITCPTAEAAIYYTLDGNFPTPASGLPYTDPFPAPAEGTMVRAVAYVAGQNPSDLLEFTLNA